MIINKENYSEFIKDEYELSFVLALEDDELLFDTNLTTLKNHLSSLKNKGFIEKFSHEDNRFHVITEKYLINLKVLHNGDVCQYTINKKTQNKGNYSRRMFPEAIINTFNKFVL
ncbi:hypothetical protein MHB48_15235 [Psychrobacillus sp. FSL H8-0483]|uniref:hypothetical protein n=1 Tax=Psychrobacillus sp. FSL H8-0483 TaxID=2921389 RepID=UPI00315A0E5F